MLYQLHSLLSNLSKAIVFLLKTETVFAEIFYILNYEENSRIGKLHVLYMHCTLDVAWRYSSEHRTVRTYSHISSPIYQHCFIIFISDTLLFLILFLFLFITCFSLPISFSDMEINDTIEKLGGVIPKQVTLSVDENISNSKDFKMIKDIPSV